jgi:hypothetical protein
MGRKAKQYTVQLTQNLDLLEKQKGHAYTATGVRVDVGLPKGHHAVLHEAPDHKREWRVTHEESGMLIGAAIDSENAVAFAVERIAAMRGDGSIDKSLRVAMRDGETYRRKLWEYAGGFVL